MLLMLLQTPIGIVLGDVTTQVPLLGDVIDGAFKGFFIIVGVLYLIFAFIATRQVANMQTTLQTPFSPVIRLLALAHLVAAGVVLFYFSTL